MRSGFPERLARALVRVAALLAPPERRKRFVREWDAELWHHGEPRVESHVAMSSVWL